MGLQFSKPFKNKDFGKKEIKKLKLIDHLPQI